MSHTWTEMGIVRTELMHTHELGDLDASQTQSGSVRIRRRPSRARRAPPISSLKMKDMRLSHVSWVMARIIKPKICAHLICDATALAAA